MDKAITFGNERVVFCGARMGYSRTVIAGGFVYTSGHTAVDDQGVIGPGDIRAQTRLVLSKLERTLATAGCGLKDIVRTTVYLADPRDYWVMNDVFNEVFPDDKPVRTAIIARPVLDTKIEIDAIAYKGQ
jgi:enamine deaminase RidA (YjgF/YER057c/UK114 family)